MKLFQVCLVLVQLVSPYVVELTEEPSVPKIKACAYVNAYLATCWWTRPKGDTTTEYKLGYLTASDPIHQRRDKYCQATRQSISGDTTIESCGVEGSMFQRFTFWVGSVWDCDAIEKSCLTSRRGDDVIFTCTKENVMLTVAPGSLSIDPEAQRLRWRPPDLANSMLDFTLKVGKRKAMYKVQIREQTQTKWEECYRGYDTTTFLPTLIPGISYEIRVFASLDPRSPGPNEIDPLPGEPYFPARQREWTGPSNVFVFKVPRPINEHSDDSSGSIVTVRYIDKSTDALEQHLILTSVVTPIAMIIILAVVAYCMPWQRWCCRLAETKAVKPKANADFARSNGYEAQRHEPNSVDSQTNSEGTIRIISVITAANNTDRVQCISPQERNNSSNLTQAPETKHEQLASPAADRTGFLFNACPETDNDLITLNDVMTGPGAVQSKTTKHLLRKRGESAHEVETVNYLMTSDTDNETMTSQSSDNSTIKYLVDSTANGSMLTDELTCVTDMTSLVDYDEDALKHCLKHHALDNISDYVIHTSTFDNDFSQNMTMFVAMATDDVTRRPSTSVTNELLAACDSEKEASHTSKQENFFAARNSSPSGKKKYALFVRSESVGKCRKASESQNNDKEKCVDQASTNRSGSLSQRSVDSGYSPGSPLCEAPSLSSRGAMDRSTEICDNLTSRPENKGSDSEPEYITYVPPT